MATTGPKVSSCMIIMSCFTSVNTVAGKKFPLALPRTSASQSFFAPLAKASSTCLLTICRCMSETMGPNLEAGSVPSPATKALALSWTFASKSAFTESSMYTRSIPQHTWPQLYKDHVTASSAAVSRSESAKMTIGSFPPSSRTRRLSELLQASMMRRPVAEEPVMATIAISGWATKHLPTSPSPWQSSTQPTGRTFCNGSSTLAPVNGATSLGLTTTVLPAARAGNANIKISAAGKFQGEQIKMMP
mmetsp:Transcript_8076/g.20535  ORF Transcript_8076/g.20535 Transcript_8076/m.20535 type:complete len:247 (-) Transcript_8076:65-805(-)